MSSFQASSLLWESQKIPVYSKLSFKGPAAQRECTQRVVSLIWKLYFHTARHTGTELKPLLCCAAPRQPCSTPTRQSILMLTGDYDFKHSYSDRWDFTVASGSYKAFSWHFQPTPGVAPRYFCQLPPNTSTFKNKITSMCSDWSTGSREKRK